MFKKIIFLSLLITQATFAQKLWQPYYIAPRSNNQHIDLVKDWELTHTSVPVKKVEGLIQNEWLNVNEPTTVHMALFKAGILPAPFKAMNSKKYEWVETSVWYYRKRFYIPETVNGNFVFLNFDGIDYFSKIWINGKYIGEHEGMFGGPTVEVSDYINTEEYNEIIVEVKSANCDNPESYKPRDPGNIIKPWEFTGGSGAEPWFTVGMWRGARLEILPKVHLERPFLTTEVITNHTAKIKFSTNVFAESHALLQEMHPWKHWPNTYFLDRFDFKPVEGDYKIKVVFVNEEGKVVENSIDLALTNGRNFIEDEIIFENPKLWWPNGLGEPNLYNVSIQLWNEDKKLDEVNFDFGIRTIEHLTTPGPRYSDVWNKWQFVINGKKVFIKGVNWMPVDVLLDLTEEKYNWAINLAKEGNIQMFRIWGAGLLETNEFYDECNRSGIMVWQDFPIANYETDQWPVDVWEAQVIHNIFRLRNQPSLVLYNGGNEFNAYNTGNSRAIGILERNLKIFDTTRMFTRTSPDGGSIHTYPDFDPVWYGSKYKYAAYVSETGMHSITDVNGLYQIIDPGEFKDLGDMYTDEFAESHPEFIHHFVEFNPARVPRMLSRASHIADMKNPTIESIAEASQVSAGEFYQVMSEKVQANYPVTAGLMPWVFKRPWPVVSAIHLVDGFGQPSAPYYFLKRTYEPLHVALNPDRLLWKSGEFFPVEVMVLNSDYNLSDSDIESISIEILDQKFNKLYEKKKQITIEEAPSVTKVLLEDFKISEENKNQYFFVVVSLLDSNQKEISRSVYWPRTISQMENEEYYKDYISSEQPWPTLEDGPWLKLVVGQTKTSLSVKVLSKNVTKEGNLELQLEIENKGKIPSFMTKIDIVGSKRLFVSDDNFFWMQPDEKRKIKVQIKWREEIMKNKTQIVVDSWNAKKQTIQISK